MNDIFGISMMYNMEYQDGCDQEPYIAQFRYLADTFYEWFKPLSAIDFGCGKAPMIQRFIELGVNAIGIEGSLFARDKFIETLDLRDPFIISTTFDLLTCFDVAEHIEEEYADILISNIVNHANLHATILFGAATLGQNGHGHVNCQPMEYWKQKIEKYGFIHDPVQTQSIIHIIKPHSDFIWWVHKNLNVYRRI